MCRIGIFASGSGTNAENLIRYFSVHSSVKVVLVLCNREGAGVLDRAARLGVPAKTFDRSDLYESGKVLQLLDDYRVDFIALAGFLWLVPGKLLSRYPDRIVNIHPALLPAYGGKGMYGQKVHEAVIRNGEKESGITIHLVNERYDEGNILFQARCPVQPGDTPGSLAARIHELEYRHYPEVIEGYLAATGKAD